MVKIIISHYDKKWIRPLLIVRDLTTTRGLPASEPYRGFFKRTHLHTTLNKSRDERTDPFPVRADRSRDRSHATAEWFEFQFSAIREGAIGVVVTLVLPKH